MTNNEDEFKVNSIYEIQEIKMSYDYEAEIINFKIWGVENYQLEGRGKLKFKLRFFQMDDSTKKFTYDEKTNYLD